MKNPPSSFESLASRLSHLEDKPVQPNLVAKLLGDFDISASELEPLLRFQESRYTRHLIYRSETFDVIVLCWPPGVGTAVHDHGQQFGWVRVLKGALEEVRYSSKGCPTQLDETQTWTPEIHSTVMLPAGPAVASVDSANGIHRLTAMDQPTVSLHIYSKPLDTCLVFEGHNGHIDRKQLKYDTTPDSRAKQLS